MYKLSNLKKKSFFSHFTVTLRESLCSICHLQKQKSAQFCFSAETENFFFISLPLTNQKHLHGIVENCTALHAFPRGKVHDQTIEKSFHGKTSHFYSLFPWKSGHIRACLQTHFSGNTVENPSVFVFIVHMHLVRTLFPRGKS